MLNKPILKTIILFTSFFVIAPLYGQATENMPATEYPLTWLESKNAARYEIIVKKENPAAREYTEIVRQMVTGTSFVVTLTSGRYCFQVIPYNQENAAGIPSSWEYFEVVFKSPKAGGKIISRPEKMVSAELSALWTPFISIPCLFGSYNEQYKNDIFQRLGATLDISVILMRVGNGYWGVDFTPSWIYLASQLEEVDSNVIIYSFEAHLLYQRRLSNRQMLNFRLGAGVSIFNEFQTGALSLSGNSISFSSTDADISAGIFYEHFIIKDFFVKAGADYLVFIMSRNRRANFIRPALGLGWRF